MRHMALYLLSYDISEKNHDYQSLWDYMDELGATKILYSEYAVPFTGKALDLVNAAAKHVMKGDRLLACELFDGGPTCAWMNLRISTEDFRAILKKYARTVSA
jgi:hypothetical protein